MLTNLITNAQRHGSRDATITIALHQSELDVSIDVDDSSPRAGASSAGTGTGLGLSIVDALIAAHGGTFQLRPNHRHGSTATIHLQTECRAERLTSNGPADQAHLRS